MTESNSPRNYLFNSRLETGLRSVVVLDATYPREFDLTTLTWLDYLVVHTADVGGPPSLHPSLTYNSGELLVRRSLVYNGLLLMRQVHLVTQHERPEGLYYQSTEHALPTIKLLRETYNVELVQRAAWISKWVAQNAEKGLQTHIQDAVGRWGVEFGTTEEQNQYE